MKECRDAPQVLIDYHSQRNSLDNYFSYYDSRQSDHTTAERRSTAERYTAERRCTPERNQVPTYAPVKTPTHRTVHEPLTITESISDHYRTSSHLDLSSRKKISAASTATADLEDALTLFYESHNIIQPTHSYLADWQIESLSGGGDSLDDTKEEYDNDILKFWEYQYKRTL